MGAAQRRSRTRRVRTGKRIEITPRDLAIFSLLQGYRYLPANYIHAFVGGASETRFKERMGDLYHEGFLGRPERQWDISGALHRHVLYEIDERGRRATTEHGHSDIRRRTYFAAGAHRQFAHAVGICLSLASFELATLAIPRVRFISWSEILERAPEQTKGQVQPFRFSLSGGRSVIPDGLFGLEYERGVDDRVYRFFALEYDRGTMPVQRFGDTSQSSYLGKLSAYDEIVTNRVHKAHLNISNLFVLTLTPSEKRLTEIMRKVVYSRDKVCFLFQSLPSADTLSSPYIALLTRPWERVEVPPLLVDR